MVIRLQRDGPRSTVSTAARVRRPNRGLPRVPYTGRFVHRLRDPCRRLEDSKQALPPLCAYGSLKEKIDFFSKFLFFAYTQDEFFSVPFRLNNMSQLKTLGSHG
jgi:hypothetical protein